MKVLVIPDIHLKPNMFIRATKLMEEGIADKTVCLMDIPDDWGQQFNVQLYEKTFDEAISFALKYPQTLWCYGNHDLSYIWYQIESGYSSIASVPVLRKLLELKHTLGYDNPIKYVHKIDNVIFCHGGICDYFVREHIKSKYYNDADKVVEEINMLGMKEMWTDLSPIWFRPQQAFQKIYKPRKLLQVVGHTPVGKIDKKGNIISCDTFSTYSDGRTIGTSEFLIVDTITWEYNGIK